MTLALLYIAQHVRWPHQFSRPHNHEKKHAHRNRHIQEADNHRYHNALHIHPPH